MSNRIGLLTIHHTTNFGSALQTYGLYSKIREMGYDISIIDYRCEAIENREFMTGPVKSLRMFYRKMKYTPVIHRKAKVFNQFFAENVKLTQTFTRQTIGDVNFDFDTFVVGSDIVWGLNVTGNDMSYFLDFVEPKKKRIAFGSSAGLKWMDEKVESIGREIKKFDNIGVREELVAEWIKEFYQMKVDVVADPTMLWESDYWHNMAVKPIYQDYILVYFCDPEEKILKDAIRMGKKYHIPVKYINYGKKKADVESIQPERIEEFLGLVEFARYVFSASYHGLLFSLYFEKEVFYYNRANFSRMESLGQWLNITDHNGMNVDVLIAKPLDYSTINTLIRQKRERSLKILKSYLESTEKE